MPDSASPASAVPPTAASIGRCTHLRADAKRCSSAVYPGHSSLCHYHFSRQMRGIADGELLAADILSTVDNFQSAAAINIALGKIFLHQLTGRLSRQDALALCYNCQLLLQSIPAAKQELTNGGYHSYWKEETKRILGGNSDLCNLTFTSLLPNGHGSVQPAPLPEPPPAPVPEIMPNQPPSAADSRNAASVR